MVSQDSESLFLGENEDMVTYRMIPFASKRASRVEKTKNARMIEYMLRIDRKEGVGMVGTIL